MKKIIYSLVIMIAAGSLFTSCVENTEPQGIKDIRQAKADYIESLAKLNAANEKLVAAEAAYKEAETAVKNAEVAVVEAQAAQAQALAAQEQAKVEIIKAQIALQEIKNAEAQAKLAKQIALDSLEVAKELLKAANFEVYSKAELEKQIKSFEAEIKGYEAKIAEAEAKIRTEKDKIAKAEAQAQKDALDLEKALVEKEAALLRAQHALELQEAAFQAYLAEVELRSYQLTPAEQSAVKEYKAAYANVIAAKQKVRKVEELIFKNDSTIENKYATELRNLKNAVIWDSTAVEFYKAQIADVEARLASLPDSGKTAEEVAALEAEYAEQLKNLEYEQAQLDLGYNTYLKTELGEPITGFATELGDWVAKNAALPAPFDMHFKAELPDNGAVSDLFKKSVEMFYEASAPVKVEDGYIYANFKTSTGALEGVYALDSIIDAISRKYIIDKVGTGLDTVGLVAAVKDAQDEYDAIADTLTDGLGKYKPFVDAQDSVKKAVEDTTKAFAEYRKAYSADTTARNEWWEARFAYRDAKDTLGRYKTGKWAQAKTDSTLKGETYKQDSTAAVTAHQTWAKENALLDTLNNLERWLTAANADLASAKVYRDTARNVKNRAATDSVAAFEKAQAAYGKPEFDSLNNVYLQKCEIYRAAVADLATKEAEVTKAQNKVNKLDGYKSKNKEEQEDKVAVAYTADTAAANKANKAKLALAKAVEAYNKAANDTLELTNAFNAAVADSVAKRTERLKVDSLYKVAVADTVDAIAYLDHVSPFVGIAKDKFYDIYEGFWGKVLTDADFNEDGFLNDSIKIAPKEFVDIFVKDGGKDIVKFNPTYAYDHENKFTGTPILVGNKEIEIIKDRLVNDYKVEFDKTLLCELFAKQQAAEDIFAAVGTVDNDEALAALTEIKESLAVAFVEAGLKQIENSVPFFTFVENLVGEEFIDGLFERIDNAMKAYAQFVDEPAASDNDVIAQAISLGITSSKEVFILLFENELCNGASDKYRQKYVELQIAEAFAGEEFRQLLSDKIASDVKKQKYESNITLVNGNSPVQGIIEAVIYNHATPYNVIKRAVLNFKPNYSAFFVKDFGGKIAELQTKWFADWSAKADEYADATAEIKAKKENIENSKAVLVAYKADKAISALITKENFSNGYIGWMKDQLAVFEYALAEAQKALAAYVGGPDIYEQHKTEHLADVLAKAENDLAIAEAALERATAAYNKVLESHSIAE